TATFTGTGAGSATTIGATIGGSDETSALPTITVTPGSASLRTFTVNTSSSTVVSGATATLTLQARDGAGNNLTAGGLTVVFTQSGGRSPGEIGCSTENGRGNLTATFMGTGAGSSMIKGATIG